MHHWLFKSEPDVFGIDDLAKRAKQTEHWDGVRNYQARNMLRDDIKRGDLGFFYHSSCTPPGIAGIIEVVKSGYPDDSAWNPKSDHYDPKCDPNNPRWFMVDVKLVRKFKHFIPLEELKKHSVLKGMRILVPGNRLSITPVSEKEWDFIVKLGE